jgi:hypothetical protein
MELAYKSMRAAPRCTNGSAYLPLSVNIQTTARSESAEHRIYDMPGRPQNGWGLGVIFGLLAMLLANN